MIYEKKEAVPFYDLDDRNIARVDSCDTVSIYRTLK